MFNVEVKFFDGEVVSADLIRFDCDLRPVVRFRSGFTAPIDHDEVAYIKFMTPLYGKPIFYNGVFAGICVSDIIGHGARLDDGAFDRLKVITESQCNYCIQEYRGYIHDVSAIEHTKNDLKYVFVFEGGYLTDIKVTVRMANYHLRVTEDGQVIPVWTDSGEVVENGVPVIIRDNPPADRWAEIVDEVSLVVGIRYYSDNSTFVEKLTKGVGIVEKEPVLDEFCLNGEEV